MINKTKGLLTIIVPCYNGEKYIHRCTSSLAGLFDDDISVLFVNDGSTDSSEKIISMWVESHPNAYIISKENGGYSSAINFGLDHCGSEYVMFLGIDDEIIPSGIRNVCTHLRENHPDIMAFTTIKIYDDLPNHSTRIPDPLTVYREEGCFEMDAFSLYKEKKPDPWILFTRDTSRCFKMARIGDLRYFGKMGVSADGCFSSLVACKSNSFEFLNEDCYLWHLHRDSVSARLKSVKRLIDEASVWESFFSHIQNDFPNIRIPYPIVTHVWTYKRVALGLDCAETKEISQGHTAKVNDIIKWIRCSHYLPWKMRIMFSFPELYCLAMQIWIKIRE